MLAEIRGANTVLSDIEDLALGTLFDAVVLGSALIHAPAPGSRAALLETCRRHVKPSEVVLVQHYRDGWPATAAPGFLGDRDGIRVSIDDLVQDGSLFHLTMRYEAAGSTWTQSFTAETLNQLQIDNSLATRGAVARMSPRPKCNVAARETNMTRWTSDGAAALGCESTRYRETRMTAEGRKDELKAPSGIAGIASPCVAESQVRVGSEGIFALTPRTGGA